MRYHKYDRNTGEFIYTEVENLKIPSNLGTPDINGVERTVNIRLARASGWHYSDNSMLFVPAYSAIRGVKMPFEISVVKTRGIVVKFKSQTYVGSVLIGDFLKACFPFITLDHIHAMVKSNSVYMSKEFLSLPNRSSLPDILIKRGNSIDKEYAVNKFKTLFTEQTQLKEGKRLKSLLSLSHFKGCYLENDTIVYDGTLIRGTLLDDSVIFQIQHSGLPFVDVVTIQGVVLTVSLLTQAYSDLRFIGSALTDEEIERVLSAEENEMEFELRGTLVPKISVPMSNTLQVYCMIINRLLNFSKIGLKIDMNAYENQVLSTLEDDIEIYNNADWNILDDRTQSTKSFLAAVSSVKFDLYRLYRSISNEESSLVVLSNIENPFAQLSSSGDTKLAKPVSHLTRSAIQVRSASLGVEDGVDVFESKNIGKSTPLTVTTNLQSGILRTPLYVVKDRQVTDIVEEVEVSKLASLIVGEYNADLTKKYVLARHMNETKYVRAEQLTHVRVSAFSSTSYCRASAPYLHHADLKRSQMAAKTMEQARTILLPERALVETGIESIAVNASPSLKFISTVREVINDYILQNKLDISINYDNDLFQLITLKTQGHVTEYKIESIQNHNVCAIFTIEYKKTIKGSCIWKEIVPSNGDYYHIDDLLIRHHDIATTKQSLPHVDALKYHTKDNPELFKHAVACGSNLKVMMGFYHCFTVDDASLLSDRVIRDMSFDTPTVFNIEYNKSSSTADSEEIFGYINGIIPKGFTPKGLPKVGTLLWGGDPVIYKYKLKKNNIREEANLYLKYDETGEVMSVVETDEKIKITLYTVIHLKVGDKLSGRHGNKTLCCKILPAELMPYDAETGIAFDIVLNPLSLVARMNIGQILELYASTKTKNSGKDMIIEPLYESVFSKYIKEYEEQGVKDLTLRKVIDAETGIAFPNKMYCGYMYILRSVHITEDKIHAIGDSKELDLGFLQPVGQGPKNQRGQSVGAMEKDLLIAKGCQNIIDEIHGILSSDVKTYREVCDKISTNGLDYIPNNKGENLHVEHMIMSTLGLYIHADKHGEKFYMRFASDEIIKRYHRLNTDNLINEITDNILCKDISYFDLHTKIVTPIALEKFNCCKVITVMKPTASGYEPTQLTSALAIAIIKELVFVFLAPSTLFKTDMYYLKYNRESQLHTGMSTLLEIMEHYSNQELNDLLDIQLNNKNSPVYVKELVEVKNQLQHIINTGGLQQYITSVVPVIPLKYRASSKDLKVLHDLTRGYLNVASICTKDFSTSTKDQQIYDKLKKLLLGTNSEYKSIFEFLFDKDANGRIRNSIMKTRVKHSLRANLTPAGYSHPDQLGLPLILALYVFQPYMCYQLRKEYDFLNNIKDDIELCDKVAALLYLPLTEVAKRTNEKIKTPQDLVYLKNIVKNVAYNRYVFYDRAPALHETSLRGARVYVHDDTTLRIHTLLTADQNADFDGDQAPVIAPMTEDSIRDIKTKLLPSSQLCRSNDGLVSLRINQDSAFGLYNATCEEPKEIGKNFSSMNQIKELVDLGLLSVNDTVIVCHCGKVFKSTAGRLIISEIVDDLTVTTLQEDGYYLPSLTTGIVTKASKDNRIPIPKLTKEILKYSNPADRIAKLQEIGYKFNHILNITLSMEDFKPFLDIPNKEEEFIEELQLLGTLEDYGLLSSDYIFNIEQKLTEYKSELNILERLGKNNAFYKMVDSGAKGSETQLSHMFGLVGFAKSPTGSLPTPILSGYVHGLSQFQSEDLSYQQRMNALSTILETSSPGEASRTGSFELSGLVVSNNTGHLPIYPHYIFYLPENIDTRYQLFDLNGNLLEDQKATGKTFRNKQIKGLSLITQLSKKPNGVVTLDDGTVMKFKRQVDPAFKEFVSKKLETSMIHIIAQAVSEQQEFADAKSFINCFENNSQIPVDYAGKYIVTGSSYDAGTQMGIKASTTLSEPANQMVISKRNLIAADEAYSGLQLFKRAIQYGKMFNNNRNTITILAPEDGEINILKQKDGTLFKLYGLSGAVYTWLVPVNNEPIRDTFVASGDIVFATQVISAIKGQSPDERIHPTLSLTWQTVKIDEIVYQDILPNASPMIIQFARFVYYKYLWGLYKGTHPDIDLNHFASSALQQLRTAEIINSLNNKSYKGLRYVNIAKVLGQSLKSIVYNFKLTDGKTTILNHSGALAGYIYQDPLASVKTAFSIGEIPETGYIGRLALGVKKGSSIEEIPMTYRPHTEINYEWYNSNTNEHAIIHNIVVDQNEFQEKDAESTSEDLDLNELFQDFSYNTDDFTVFNEHTTTKENTESHLFNS